MPDRPDTQDNPEESPAADVGPRHDPDDHTARSIPQTLDELWGEYFDYCVWNHAHGVRDHPTLYEFVQEYFPTISNGTDSLWVREAVLETAEFANNFNDHEQGTSSAAEVQWCSGWPTCDLYLFLLVCCQHKAAVFRIRISYHWYHWYHIQRPCLCKAGGISWRFEIWRFDHIASHLLCACWRESAVPACGLQFGLNSEFPFHKISHSALREQSTELNTMRLVWWTHMCATRFDSMISMDIENYCRLSIAAHPNDH